MPVIYMYIPRSVCVCVTTPVCFTTWLSLLVDSIIVPYGHYGNKHTEFLYGQMTLLVIAQRLAYNPSTQKSFIAPTLVLLIFLLIRKTEREGERETESKIELQKRER